MTTVETAAGITTYSFAPCRDAQVSIRVTQNPVNNGDPLDKKGLNVTGGWIAAEC